MKKRKKKNSLVKRDAAIAGYDNILVGVVDLLESARRLAARAVNSIMTATYWEIGRRIVEFEQGGKERADYGGRLLEHLSQDLSSRFGRGFSIRNLRSFRAFYLGWTIRQTPSAESEQLPDTTEKLQAASAILSNQKIQTASGKSQDMIQRMVSAEFGLDSVARRFPLSWSHYVKLMSVKNPKAREFYEAESLRGGWSVRQLTRQINSMFYERTALSRNKAAMLRKGQKPLPEDAITPEEEIKDPFILEFLGLKDEYSESDLEEALIRQLEDFLMELGGDFAFIGRQRRLRIGDQWFRVDLIFFHRGLRCLVIIDLKIGEFTHADAGQMHLYLNYAREHWTRPNENPPVGLILCAEKDSAVAHYALEGLPNKVMAAEYRTTLPDEEILAAEMERTRKMLEGRAEIKGKKKAK